jgi:thiamine-monophosphate kinase
VAEFDLIELIRARCAIARDDVRLGIGDDAALLAVPAGRLLAVSTDTLVEGIHFPKDTAPFDLGWKALAVNLSDLAAMGATPAWATLNLTLPRADARWVEQFADGFVALARKHEVALVGGDTTQGPLSITITVHGLVREEAALRRAGARAGDVVCVTGTLGDAAAGLRLIMASAQDNALASNGLTIEGDRGVRGRLPDQEPPSPQPSPPMVKLSEEREQKASGATQGGAKQGWQAVSTVEERGKFSITENGRKTFDAALMDRLNRPIPRVAQGLILAGRAHACIDISDGLVADLGHICRASGVAAEIDADALPTSDALAALFDREMRRPLQLAGGDDYELCFTAEESSVETLLADLARSGVAATSVGRIVVGAGVRVRDGARRPIEIPRAGWQHFAV